MYGNNVIVFVCILHFLNVKFKQHFAVRPEFQESPSPPHFFLMSTPLQRRPIRSNCTEQKFFKLNFVQLLLIFDEFEL